MSEKCELWHPPFRQGFLSLWIGAVDKDVVQRPLLNPNLAPNYILSTLLVQFIYNSSEINFITQGIVSLYGILKQYGLATASQPLSHQHTQNK